MQSTVIRRIGIVALVGGLWFVSDGQGVIPAAAAPPGKGSTADLSGVTQNWDKVLPADQRFTLLAAFNNETLRDNKTGLVWEKSPATTTHIWGNARGECTSRTTGGRKAWRLPSVSELASLIGSLVANAVCPS